MFKRAYHDTVRQIGGPGGIFLLLVSPFAAYFVLRYFGGAKAVTGAWAAITAGLAGVGATALMMFLYNLIAAPFRIERDKRQAIQARVLDLERQVGQPSKIQIFVRQVIWGGVDPDGKRVVMLGIAVANTGALDTTLRGWGNAVRRGDTLEVGSVTLPHRNCKIMLSSSSHKSIEVTWDDMIVNRTADRLERGRMVEGFLLGGFSEEIMGEGPIPIAIAQCEDIFGGQFCAEQTLGPGNDSLAYMPQLAEGAQGGDRT